jgi:hypothetical protein
MSFPRLALLFLFAAAAPAVAQDAPARADSAAAPAVRLDVEHLALDSLALTAERVEAHLSIDASVAQLLRIDAGLRVEIDSVHVTIEGVRAAADLRVHLDVVARVLLEALGVVDRHPEAFAAPALPPGPNGEARPSAEDERGG